MLSFSAVELKVFVLQGDMSLVLVAKDYLARSIGNGNRTVLKSSNNLSETFSANKRSKFVNQDIKQKAN
jgi:hypothetical protein